MQASLFRAGLTDLDKCSLCNLESQSLPHLLITCPLSMTFWDLFTCWWQLRFHQHIALSEKVTLYGWLQNCSSVNSVALNYSLIIALWLLKAKNLINLKKRGLLCFGRVSVLCVCVRVALENVMIIMP